MNTIVMLLAGGFLAHEEPLWLRAAGLLLIATGAYVRGYRNGKWGEK